MSGVIAKRKLNFNALKNIGFSIDKYCGIKYVLIHFYHNSELFGCNYVCCENLTDLNDVKSKILNNGFRIKWDKFNECIEYLNGH